jgi:predicted dinucleotide-binding enzyme
MGQTLAHGLAAAGHRVTMCNTHDPQTLGGIVHAMPGRVGAGTVGQVADGADLVILAVPFAAVKALPPAALMTKVVIDATNYDPDRDGHDAALDDHFATSSELVAEALPGARVVKSFNAMRYDHLREYGHGGGAEMRYGIPVSGNDEEAKYLVMTLIDTLGYDPIDAGTLADGRNFEPGSAVYEADLSAEDMQAAIGVK